MRQIWPLTAALSLLTALAGAAPPTRLELTHPA
jgi:hypothetical protein